MRGEAKKNLPLPVASIGTLTYSQHLYMEPISPYKAP